MLVTTSLIWQTIWLEKSRDNESLIAWRLAHVVRILIPQLPARLMDKILNKAGGGGER